MAILFSKSKMHAMAIWLGDCEDDGLCIIYMNVHSKNLFNESLTFISLSNNSKYSLYNLLKI